MHLARMLTTSPNSDIMHGNVNKRWVMLPTAYHPLKELRINIWPKLTFVECQLPVPGTVLVAFTTFIISFKPSQQPCLMDQIHLIFRWRGRLYHLQEDSKISEQAFGLHQWQLSDLHESYMNFMANWTVECHLRFISLVWTILKAFVITWGHSRVRQIPSQHLCVSI